MNEPNFYLKTMWQGVLAVVLCACFAIPAQAQTPVVTLDARNVTIKELLQRIEAASPYTFAYVNAEIDTPPHRKVTVNAENRSIESILAEVLPNVSVEIKGRKIILTAKPKETPKAAADAATAQQKAEQAQKSKDNDSGDLGLWLDEEEEQALSELMRNGKKEE